MVPLAASEGSFWPFHGGMVIFLKKYICGAMGSPWTTPTVGASLGYLPSLENSAEEAEGAP